MKYSEAKHKKYFIHVLKTEYGYLNTYKGTIKLNNNYEDGYFKTKFTDQEIDQLKNRDDVPLDWSKVELEPVN